MRKLTFFLSLLGLAALGWGVYWYVGARAMEAAYSGWLAERRAEGWVAEAEIHTNGLPNRFDTSFEGLQLADPDTGAAWSAPLFQILSLSYRPHHVILLWPGTQSVALPDQSVTVTSADMRGSLKLAPELALPLQTITIVAEESRFASTQGWVASLTHGQLAMRLTPGAEPEAHRYDVALSLEALDPGEAFLAITRDISGLPQIVEGAEIEATVDFDTAWDRRSIEQRRPQPQRIALDRLEAQWGGLKLSASGVLEVDAKGLPTGTLDMKATEWREMLALARASGAMSPEYDAALTRGLELIAALSGDPDTLDLPLSFNSGLVFLGPVPVGPAPLLRLP